MQLSDLKGIGEKRLALLAEMGITTIEELVYYFPKRYIEYEKPESIDGMEDGGCYAVNATVMGAPSTFRSRAGKVHTKCRLLAFGEEYGAVWFNNRFVGSSLKENTEYLFSGHVERKDGICFLNPTFREVHKGDSSVQPVYALPPLLTQNLFSSLVASALQVYRGQSVLQGEEFCDLNFALRTVHFPKSYAAAMAASSRIATEELVQLILTLRLVSASERCLRKVFYGDDSLLDSFLSRLPFCLTHSQQSAIQRISTAMRGEYRLNCLLQGDVGSGKTAVAFALMEYAAKSGHQAVLMSPTEVLACQHLKNAQKMFDPAIGLAYLSGSQNAKERKINLDRIKSGEAQIILATHAAISCGVEYANLSLIVTDEQHRFGVRQRLKLEEKGDFPDVIVMSATPIPRTLALVVYGDLDVITLDTKPAGRQKIKTSVVPAHKEESMLSYIAKQVAGEHQAYLVCPVIDGGEEGTLHSVNELTQKLKKGAFQGVPVAALHGKMSEEEKSAVMADFASGKTRALVATTVIEVGVDVPAADIIAIFDADRFGLAALHQLRGRVGRGGGESFCYLLTNKGGKSVERLKFLESTDSGFDIADRDFETRGGGDFFGNSQSGFISAVFQRLKPDGKTVMRAKEIAAGISITQEKFLEIARSEYAEIIRVTL